jgi:hypothetical protein
MVSADVNTSESDGRNGAAVNGVKAPLRKWTVHGVSIIALI